MEFKPAPLTDSGDSSEASASRLIVKRGDTTKEYRFHSGCELLRDDSASPTAWLLCPNKFAGVFVTSQILQVNLDSGVATSVASNFVYTFKSPLREFFVGVRLKNALKANQLRDRELVVLALQKGAKLNVVARGAWLPSDLDLELLGEPKKWEEQEKQWAKLFRFEGENFQYRRYESESFKSFHLLNTVKR